MKFRRCKPHGEANPSLLSLLGCGAVTLNVLCLASCGSQRGSDSQRFHFELKAQLQM